MSSLHALAIFDLFGPAFSSLPAVPIPPASAASSSSASSSPSASPSLHLHALIKGTTSRAPFLEQPTSLSNAHEINEWRKRQAALFQQLQQRENRPLEAHFRFFPLTSSSSSSSSSASLSAAPLQLAFSNDVFAKVSVAPSSSVSSASSQSLSLSSSSSPPSSSEASSSSSSSDASAASSSTDAPAATTASTIACSFHSQALPLTTRWQLALTPAQSQVPSHQSFMSALVELDDRMAVVLTPQQRQPSSFHANSKLDAKSMFLPYVDLSHSAYRGDCSEFILGRRRACELRAKGWCLASTCSSQQMAAWNEPARGQSKNLDRVAFANSSNAIVSKFSHGLRALLRKTQADSKGEGVRLVIAALYSKAEQQQQQRPSDEECALCLHAIAAARQLLAAKGSLVLFFPSFHPACSFIHSLLIMLTRMFEFVSLERVQAMKRSNPAAVFVVARSYRVLDKSDADEFQERCLTLADDAMSSTSTQSLADALLLDHDEKELDAAYEKLLSDWMQSVGAEAMQLAMQQGSKYGIFADHFVS